MHALEVPKMNTDRIEDIFVEATELDSPEERAAYLDEACKGDPDVRQRVEALLAAHDGPESVLDEAAILPRAAMTVDPSFRRCCAEYRGIS
jgi:hypothetical protein